MIPITPVMKMKMSRREGVMQASLENSDSSDSDSDDASKYSDLSHSESDDAGDLPVSENVDGGQPSSNQRGTLSEQASLENKSATLQTEVELQLKTFF